MPFDRHAKLALIVSVATLLASSVGFRYAVAALNIYLRKEPVELRGSFSTIPQILGEWKQVGEDVQLDDAVLKELGTEDTISRTYAIDGESSRGLLSVHVAYYTGMIDAVPHIPDRCFVASGLEPQGRPEVLPLPLDLSKWSEDPGSPNRATGEPYRRVEHRHSFTNQLLSTRMPVGEMAIRVTEFASRAQPGVRVFGGFFFVANGRVASVPEEIRLLAFKPSERYAYYCKVQFVLAGPTITNERYVQSVADFLDEFLPELMLRLPDWQEVEHRSSLAATPAAKP